MKQKSISKIGSMVYVCVILFLVGIIVLSLEHKPQEAIAAPAKHESITTEIPVQRIRCVKPGHNFCLEYRVFNEVRQ